jgi:hypothetical protein
MAQAEDWQGWQGWQDNRAKKAESADIPQSPVSSEVNGDQSLSRILSDSDTGSADEGFHRLSPPSVFPSSLSEGCVGFVSPGFVSASIGTDGPDFESSESAVRGERSPTKSSETVSVAGAVSFRAAETAAATAEASEATATSTETAAATETETETGESTEAAEAGEVTETTATATETETETGESTEAAEAGEVTEATATATETETETGESTESREAAETTKVTEAAETGRNSAKPAAPESESESEPADRASPAGRPFTDDFEEFSGEAEGPMQGSERFERHAPAKWQRGGSGEDGGDGGDAPASADERIVLSEEREGVGGEIVEFSLADQDPRIQIQEQTVIADHPRVVGPPSVSRDVSVRSRRFAGLKSAYSPRAFTARGRDAPVRPPPSAGLKKWMDAALGHRSLKGATQEILEEVLAELQGRQKELAIVRRFSEAARYYDASEFVHAFHVLQSKSELQQEGLARHEVQAKAAQDELRAYDRETGRLFAELKAGQAKKRQDLIDGHDSERREHSMQWGSKRKERHYNRPSNRVMILRHQQTLMAAQYRFLEAAAVKKIISDATQSEVFVRTKSWGRDYDESLSQLKVKQAAELDFLDEHSGLELAQFQQQRAVLRRSLENKNKKIETQGSLIKDIDRYWTMGEKARQTKALEVGVSGCLLRSSHVTVSELAQNESGFLALPRLSVELPARRSPRPKESE